MVLPFFDLEGTKVQVLKAQPMSDPFHERTKKASDPLVFKVLPETSWIEACKLGAFAGSSDDMRDGFIHLSAAHQLAGTLNKYFAGRTDLVLVAYRTEALGPALRWEPSRGGDLFPHLYAPLPTAAALWQRPLHLGPDGVAFLEEDWFQC
jgi:uncharacterized protein (DUF952 family)